MRVARLLRKWSLYASPSHVFSVDRHCTSVRSSVISFHRSQTLCPSRMCLDTCEKEEVHTFRLLSRDCTQRPKAPDRILRKCSIRAAGYAGVASLCHKPSTASITLSVNSRSCAKVFLDISSKSEAMGDKASENFVARSTAESPTPVAFFSSSQNRTSSMGVTMPDTSESSKSPTLRFRRPRRREALSPASSSTKQSVKRPSRPSASLPLSTKSGMKTSRTL
mmetsp:Transcript_20857/g.49524  ORF Transcript_20857/g.49524 Transcript_20857/m.49524 type:complete len:222 (+) Transcript_20857:1013-1678(+)